MKIDIGPYRGDLIPIRRWEMAYVKYTRPGTYYLPEEEYTKRDKVFFRVLGWIEDISIPINRFWRNRKRKVKIRIDYYDVWSADYTLGMIIAPVLKKLRECQTGYPHVDDEDVPEHLRLSESELQDEVDNKHQARWNWVLDEMIWTFEQYASDDDEAQYHHNSEQLHMVTRPYEDNPDLKYITFDYQKDPSKPAYWVDREGKKKHHERKQNGLRLFAKYYAGLWD